MAEEVKTANVSESYESTYALLQMWYLARLRTAAAEFSQRLRLTPLAKIARDRRAIERLVSSATHTPLVVEHPDRPYKVLIAGWAAVSVGTIFTEYLLGGSPVSLISVVFVTFAYAALVFLFIRMNEKTHFRMLLSKWNSLKRAGIEMPATMPDTADELEDELVDLALESAVRERSIADYSPNLLVAIDESLKITCCNMATLRILGYMPDEITGEPLSRFLARPTKEELAETIAAQGNRREFSIDVAAIAKSGAIMDLRMLAERSSKQNLLFCEMQDITAEKALHRARSEFVSTVSHDVRAPLQGVLFSVESMTRGVHGELSEPAQLAVERIQRNVESVIELVSELIDFERSTNAAVQIDTSEVDIFEVVSEVTEDITDYAQGLKVSLVNKVEPLTVVRADRRRVRRVLMNLLSNALKYSPPSGNVVVSSHKQKYFIEIAVSDEGPGVPEHLRAAVFDPYFQVPDSKPTADAAKTAIGSGLGLSICKTFVEAHNGTVGVRSNESGKGSTFWFTLPSITRPS